MICLPAIEPNGLRILDFNSESSLGGRVRGIHKSREETTFQRVTRILKGGLSDRVVLGKVVELDLAADSGFKVIRVVSESTVCPDVYLESFGFLGSDGGGCQSNAKDGSREPHVEK